MARLNTRGSVTPSATAHSTTTLQATPLYQDPTPRNGSGKRRSTTLASEITFGGSPTPSQSSDKENQDVRQNGKAKTSMGPPSARNGARADSSQSNKRRRLGEHNVPLASQGTYNAEIRVDEYVDLQFYDPDQDPETRRQVRQHMRENARELHDRRDELVQPDNSTLIDMLRKADGYMLEVRQTSDATVDSRFLLDASDIALKKAQNLALGDNGLGVDVDEFVSKCITFMRNGGPLGADEEEPVMTQRQRPRSHVDEEDFEDGDGLDWEAFGGRACFPNNRRPPVPSFLLGPLSVQKRARTIQRRARIERNRRTEETRPEELKAQDLQKAETSNLTTLCRNIRTRLGDYIQEATERIDNEAETEEDLPDLLVKHRLAMDDQEEPCVRLLEFAINPHSFGQTVENLFYISFLIRDGSAEVALDKNGEAILKPQIARTIQQQREQDVAKSQSILGIDWTTWKTFIRAYEIEEPLIPHRDDEVGQQLTGRGWYG